MKADYTKCAREIYEVLGGKGSLVSADHCATRLRMVTTDIGSADMERLEQIDGVKGVFSSNGQIHVIIGTDAVAGVYDEFINISGLPKVSGERQQEAGSKESSAWKRVVKAIGDVW